MRHCKVGVLHRQDFGVIPFDSKPGPHFPIPSTNGREHHELGNACWDLPEWRCGTIVEDWGSERRKHRCSFVLPSSRLGWWHAFFFFFFFLQGTRPMYPNFFTFFFSRVLSLPCRSFPICSIIHYISTSGKMQQKSYVK